MDTAPAAPSDAPNRIQPGGRPATGGRPTIGFPSIPSRSDQDPEPVPVPSIPLPGEPAAGAVPVAPAGAPAPAEPVEAEPDDSGGDPAAPDDPAALVHLAAVPPAAARGRTAVALTEESFAPAVRAKLKSYVYLLVDPRTGRPFYAGLGRDDRCFDHLRAARDGRSGTGTEGPSGTGTEGSSGTGGGYAAVERVRQIESSGRPVRIEILRYGLDPSEALMAEAVAHDLLGLPGSPAGGSQRRPVGDIRLLLTKRVKFKRPHQVVLLRVGPPGADTSYEHARHGWRIGKRWVDVGGPRSPHWAVVVAGELVDSVYRLDRWEPLRPGPGAVPGRDGGQAVDRYSFVGTRDPELERRYVGKSVALHMGKGSQGTVAYVWCGPHWVNTAS